MVFTLRTRPARGIAAPENALRSRESTGSDLPLNVVRIRSPISVNYWLKEDGVLGVGGAAANVNGYPSFDVLADFIPQFVWMCTPDGLNIYFNQRWVDYTGLTLEQSYGWGWNTPFHPDDKQAAWDAWNRATVTGEPYLVESRLRAVDGSYRWFLMRGEPLKDATGGVAHWFGSCTDINDLKLTKEAMAQHAALLELVHDAIFVRGAKSEVTFWNRGAEELYGWTRQEAIGRVTQDSHA